MSSPLAIALPTRRTTRLLARRVAAVVFPGDVIYLEGPLGAGKTFFTRALCRTLGVPGVVPVQSPTFALMHSLEGARGGQALSILHCDFYRLNGEDEVDELGLRELVADHIVVVEWGFRFRTAIGAGLLVTLWVRDGLREATLASVGARGEELLAALLAG